MYARRRLWGFMAAACLFLGLVQQGRATFINITTMPHGSVSNDQVFVLVEAVNKGDEKARNVRFEALFPGAPQSSSVFDNMEPNAKVDHQFTWKLPAGARYRQMVVPLVAHYADGNMYPFSSVTYLVVSEETPPVATLFGKIDPVAIVKTGVLSLELRSLDGKNHKAEMSLVLPKELSTDETVTVAEVPATGRKVIPISVQNFSALSGSRYVVLVVLSEQTANGIVQSAVIGNVMTQSTRDYLMGYASKAAAALAIVLGVVYVILLGRSRRRRAATTGPSCR